MRLANVSLILGCALASPVLGQPAPPPTDEALAAKLASAAELADQNRRSEALNAQVNAKNKAVDARNAAIRTAYDKAQADYKQALAQHDADAAQGQAAYQKSVEAWKADVAACKAGEVKRCGVPGPAQPPKTQAKPPTTSRTASP